MRRIFSAALQPEPRIARVNLGDNVHLAISAGVHCDVARPDETSTVIAPLETFKVRSKPPVSEAAAGQTHVPKIRRSRPRFLADFIAFSPDGFPGVTAELPACPRSIPKAIRFLEPFENTNRHRHFLPAVFGFRIWYLDGCVAVFVVNYGALGHD